MNENDIIIELANRLGIATEQIFNIFTQSIKGMAMLDMICTFIFFIGIIVIFKFMCMYTNKRYYSDNNDTIYTNFDSDDWGFVIISTMLAGLVWFMFIIVIDCMMCNYLFPEYMAIKKMLILIK